MSLRKLHNKTIHFVNNRKNCSESDVSLRVGTPPELKSAYNKFSGF
jgi:hypothetical protein